MKKVKILMGVDDTNPKFGKNDFGGNIENGKLNQLIEVCEKFPGFKVTHFVPAKYQLKEQNFFRKIKKKYYKITNQEKKIPGLIEHHGDEFLLTKNKKWINFIKKQIRKKYFSAEMHGLTHLNEFKADAQEFLNLTYFETEKKINKSIEIFRKGGLPKPKVLAPPGWSVTENLLKVLRKKKIMLAGSMMNSDEVTYKSNGTGIQNVSSLKVEIINGVKNIPRNWDLKNGTIEKAKKIIKLNGIISIHSHIENYGVKNGINEKNLKNLKDLLRWAEKNCKVNYTHFREAK